MMGLISRVLSRTGIGLGSSGNSTLSSEFTDRDIENYYFRIISDCLGRMLVPAEDIEVIVKRSRVDRYGLSTFTAYVRILKWHPVVTPVLLQNMPVVDARVRRLIKASVILEQTHFSGLWFQVSSAAEGMPTSLLGLPSELIHQPGGSQRPA
ncbi:MAG: hypothetical protein ABI409_00590 [Ramlibacter sp.]